jgi:outer membrane protein assembly factor BamB
MEVTSNRRWRGVQFSLLLMLSTLASQAAAQTPQWPMFRGPNASGRGAGTAPPVRWNGETGEGLAWKTAIPGMGHSSPVVWGDRIFLTTAVSAEPSETFDPGAARGSSVAGSRPRQSWELICLDRRSGRIVWQRTARSGEPRIGRHAKGSHANATAATDGEHVVAFFGSEGLYVYTMQGDLVWSRDLGVIDVGYVGQAQYQWGTASSPLLHDGMVIIQADAQQDSFIAAFDVRTGQQRWRHSRDELPSWSTPVIARTAAGPVIVTNGPRFMRGIDPSTGRELWRIEDGAEVKVPTPVVGDKVVVMSGGAPRGRQFYGLKPERRPQSGPGDRVVWTVEKGGPYTPTPIILGDRLLVVSDNGVLSRYDLASGRLVDQARVPASGGAYSASPVAVDRLLYLASEDGDVHVVRSGADVTVVSTNPMGEPIMATPAIADGMLIVRGARHLFGIAEAGA